MKKLLLVIALLAMAFTVYADDKKPKEEKFEVTISIVYNSVSSDEAISLARLAHEAFKNTCKHSVNIKKVGDNNLITVFSGTTMVAPTTTFTTEDTRIKRP